MQNGIGSVKERADLNRKTLVALALIGILGLGMILRCYRIGYKGLREDEILTIRLVTEFQFEEELPIEKVIDPAPQLRSEALLSPHLFSWVKGLHFQTHPPFYFLLLHLWLRIWGDPRNAAIVRLPSIFFGTLTIPLVFLLGSRLVSWKVGLVAALLFAVSPFEIFGSQEVRQQTLWTCLVTVSYLSLLSLSTHGHRWAVCLYGISLAGAFYTHYLTAFVFLSQGLYLMMRPEARSSLKQWIKAVLLGFFFIALFLPSFLLAQLKLSDTSVWIRNEPLLPKLLEGLVFIPAKLILGPEVGFHFYALPRPWQLLWVLGAMVGVSVFGYGGYRWLKADRNHLRPFWFLAFWILIPILGLLVADLFRHSILLSISRYMAMISPALFLMIASGGQGLQQRLRGIAFFCLMAVMAIRLAVYYQDPVKIQDWKGLALFLQEQSAPGDLLVFNQVGKPPWVAPLATLCITYYRGTEGRPIYLTGVTVSQKTKEVLGTQRRLFLIPKNPSFSDPGPPFKPILRREVKGIGPVALFERSSTP